MPRYIDADKLIHEIRKELDNFLVNDTYTKGRNAGLRKALIMIQESETAYDLDMVIAQLYENILSDCSNSQNDLEIGGKVEAYSRAIDIVKSGVIDNRPNCGAEMKKE